MDKRIQVGACQIHLLGTIAGFVPDGDRVAAALAANPEAVALGVPPEDLPGLATFAAADNPALLISKTAPTDEAAGSAGVEDLLRPHAQLPTAVHEDDAPFVDLDETQQRLLELLSAYGDIEIPSPDLMAAYRYCEEHNVPLEAIDLDDEEHANVYIRANKFRHVLRSGRILKKLMKAEFQATTAAELAIQWDAFQTDLPSLKAVEAAREEQMANRILELAATHASLVAIVPVARAANVAARLRA